MTAGGDPMIGQTVGNYRILNLLGEGGMGVVYLAEHPGIGRRAAVKVLHAGMAQNAEIVGRFFNEARAANAVRHPGIVEVFDFGTLPSGATYIIMELLDGESLASRLRRPNHTNLGAAVEIASQTAGVLAATHAKNIVHRDLKPDNLFLVPDQRAPGRELVKVLDFGIAKLSQESSGSGGAMTRTGAVMGTPLYMSPEQCRGAGKVDHRTDIYALGVILFEMLCGRPPFVSEGQGELIHMHIAVAPPSPRSFNPRIPEALAQVVLKTLAKDPDARFQSMDDLLVALTAGVARTLTADLAAFPGTSARPVASSQPPRRGPGFPTAPPTTFTAGAGALEGEALVLPPRRGPWRVLGLVGVLAAGGIVAGLKLTGGAATPERPPPETKPAPVAVAPSAPAVASPSPAVASPPPKPTPAPIAVGILSEPSGARVVRVSDGADIGDTPFKESWPAREGVEKLRIELEGYRPESFVVPLDRGVDLKFALKQIVVAPPASHEKKARSAHHESAPAANAPPPAAPKPPPRAEPVPL